MEERPLYENGKNLEAEAQVKKKIEEWSNSKLEKLPIKYHADYLAFKHEKISALIEVKCINFKKEQTPEFLISVDKIVSSIFLAEILKIPFFLFVRWIDNFGYVLLYRELLKDLPIRIYEGNYRNDKGDREPCYYIPISLFETN